MKRLLTIILLFSLNSLATQYVAVLETLGALKEINHDERLFLTDALRQIALTSLPSYMGYSIMTRENIRAMLPPDKLEECEGSCLVETGKNISANFVTQARIGTFGNSLSLTVELYETSSGKLISSFIGKGNNADDLRNEIESKAPALFSAIKGPQIFTGGSEGFSVLQENESFSMNANRQYVVRVNSKPEGAMLSVDGRPKCKSTPCNVQLVSGNHNFTFTLDMYFDKDTSINILSNNQQVNAALLPNFGVLNLNPQIDEYGNESELDIRIDEKVQKTGSIRLIAGKHHVEIKHACYEPMSFDVSIKNGSELTFDRAMHPAMGGLELNAEYNGEPQVVPVYINDVESGQTPYYGEVPNCAKISLKDNGWSENVNEHTKRHEVAHVTHKLKHNPTGITITETLVDESIPTNVSREENNNTIRWISLGAGSIATVVGTIMAVVGNNQAKKAYNKRAYSEDEFKKKIDDAKSGQRLRGVGIGLAITGAVGIGISFGF